MGVDTHVLRYWESEFAIIKPFRGKSKQRLYRRQDVDNLLLVKQLLHEQGYTIAGAKKVLTGPKPGKQATEESTTVNPAPVKEDLGKPVTASASVDIVETIRAELSALQQLLARKTES